MEKRIKNALISVFNKDGLSLILQHLSFLQINIYSTGGTRKYIEEEGFTCIPVETLTNYPEILGGRVKTLHPSIFGGILARRDNEKDLSEMESHAIPFIDLVIVDLYPFEETVANTSDEKLIIEKIDIGGPSMIRAAAKNYADVVVIASKKEYPELQKILEEQNGETTLSQRRHFAAKAFDICSGYDIAISNYFSGNSVYNPYNSNTTVLRYGENPHQDALFTGNLRYYFDQLNGKELSYNNIVDADGALQLVNDLTTHFTKSSKQQIIFAILKHTNVCGVACRDNVEEAWAAALSGDPQSAFGGVLITNGNINNAIAESINDLFFEVLIAPCYEEGALEILKKKKNRILLKNKNNIAAHTKQYRSVLNGLLIQDTDEGNYSEWKEVGGHASNDAEKADLQFANIVCKHLKSNAIALVKNTQLIGKGCGQTSRIDALEQAIHKAKEFNFDISGSVIASDAFFPFDDCVKIADKAGVTCFIQPGGSIRDKDSIAYCIDRNLVMVITGRRHFKH